MKTFAETFPTFDKLGTLSTQCHDVLKIISHYGSFYPMKKAKKVVELKIPFSPWINQRQDIGPICCATDRNGCFFIAIGDMDVLRAYDANGSLIWSLDHKIHDPAQIVERNGELFVLAWDSIVSNTPWKQTRLLYVFDCGTGALKRQQHLETHEPFFKGHPKTIGILSTGEFVLTDWADRVVVFDKSGTFKSFFKLNEYSMVDLIYIHTDDTIWLTGCHLLYADIVVYNRDGRLLSTIDIGGDCHQLSVTPIGEIFAAVKKGILVLNPDQTFSRIVTSDGTYRGVAVSTVHGRMIAGDHTRVAIFSSD